jgi:large subunit ribosomal protein L25
MERLRLEVAKRQGTGKSVTRKLRAQGSVPAVLYGSGVRSALLAVTAREGERVLGSGANRLIDLSGTPESSGKLVLIKDYQRDPVSRQLLHFDFYAVDPSKAVEVSVPVQLTGRPKGVELGGVLELLLREVLVSCLPLAIPDFLSLDVSPLGVGETLHARDFALPEGVELLTDPSAGVVHVLAPRLEAEEPKPEEAAEAAAGTEQAPAEEAAE